MEKIKVKLPEGVNKSMFTFCRHKAYFDKGYSLTSYMKLIIAVFGIGAVVGGSKSFAVAMLVIYAIFSYFLGMIWYKSKMIYAEFEVGNQFDMFERQVRQKLDLK